MSPFRYSFSDYDENAYVYKFPVYRSGYFITLECELILFDKTGDIEINVYEYGTRSKYAAFYCQKYGKNNILNVTYKNIEKEFQKLGIIENVQKEKIR